MRLLADRLRGGRGIGVADLVGMLDKAAGRHETACKQALAAGEEARGKAETVGDGIRLGDDRAVDPEPRIADEQFVADLHVHPFEQKRRHDRAIGAIVARQQFAKWAIGFGDEAAVEWIGFINGLYFHQRLVGTIGQPGHRAQVCRDGHRTEALQEGEFFRRCLSVVELEAHIAGEQRASLRGDRIGYRRRHGVHGRNGAGP